MIFMHKVSNNVLTANLLSYFKKVNESHDHNTVLLTLSVTRKNKNNVNISFARTTKKICKGSKIWNALKK